MTARQRNRASSPWGRGVNELLDALAVSIKDLAWHDDAACRDVGGDAWFPEQGEHAFKAREICKGCPVRQECLDDGLAHGDEHGLWGGYSRDERSRIQQKRGQVAA